MANGCSGCTTEKWCTKNRYDLSKNKCPCYTCLVKPVCTLGCDDYSKWSINVEQNIKYERSFYAVE